MGGKGDACLLGSGQAGCKPSSESRVGAWSIRPGEQVILGMGKKGRTVYKVAEEHIGDRESRRYKWEWIGVRLSVAGKGKEEESRGLAGGEQCGRESTPSPSILFSLPSLFPLLLSELWPACLLLPHPLSLPSPLQPEWPLSLNSGSYSLCTSSGN